MCVDRSLHYPTPTVPFVMQLQTVHGPHKRQRCFAETQFAAQDIRLHRDESETESITEQMFDKAARHAAASQGSWILHHVKNTML